MQLHVHVHVVNMYKNGQDFNKHVLLPGVWTVTIFSCGRCMQQSYMQKKETWNKPTGNSM